jgi:hypothetical protein
MVLGKSKCLHRKEHFNSHLSPMVTRVREKLYRCTNYLSTYTTVYVTVRIIQTERQKTYNMLIAEVGRIWHQSNHPLKHSVWDFFSYFKLI